MLFNKLLYIAHDKNEQYDGGQDEAYINTRPLRELHTLAGIGFLNEALPAPAIAAGTEQQVSCLLYTSWPSGSRLPASASTPPNPW